MAMKRHPDDLSTAEMAAKHNIPLATMRGLVRRWRAMGEENRRRETQACRDFADRIPNDPFSLVGLPGFPIPEPMPGEPFADNFYKGLLEAQGMPVKLAQSQAKALLICASVRFQKGLSNWRQSKILASKGVSARTISFEGAVHLSKEIVRSSQGRV